MGFFWNLRTEIEKTAERQDASYSSIESLNVNDIQHLPRPPGAFSFFIGDRNGGTGWEVKLPDGSIEKYYIKPPDSWQVRAGLVLSKAPDEFKGADARNLVGRYLDRMESIVADARKKFS
ncbi:MAG: hypothetical protein JWP25_7171 [Bradyrhizobium sp.]|nr:hypothetical protein [Bradyrhizobium sp.]